MGEFYCLFSIHLHKCMDLLIPTTTVQIVKTYTCQVQTSVSRTKHSEIKTDRCNSHSRHLLFRSHHCSSKREQYKKEKSAQEPRHSSYSIFNFEGIDNCVQPILHLFPSSLVCSSGQCVKFACSTLSTIRK